MDIKHRRRKPHVGIMFEVNINAYNTKKYKDIMVTHTKHNIHFSHIACSYDPLAYFQHNIYIDTLLLSRKK